MDLTIEVDRYVIGVMPRDHVMRPFYELAIEWRGGTKWAVFWGNHILNSDGNWDVMPVNIAKEPEGYAGRHYFALHTAFNMALIAARTVRFRDVTAEELLAREGIVHE
jgi:hypothetical protein